MGEEKRQELQKAQDAAKRLEDMKKEKHQEDMEKLQETVEKEQSAEKAKVEQEEKSKKKAAQAAADKEAVRLAEEEAQAKQEAEKLKTVEEEKKKAEEEDIKNPAPGMKLTQDPILPATGKIPKGQPCKVLLQEADDSPYEFRTYKTNAVCEDGFNCDTDRDIAAISYFKEDSDISIEISGSVFYCAQ